MNFFLTYVTIWNLCQSLWTRKMQPTIKVHAVWHFLPMWEIVSSNLSICSEQWEFWIKMQGLKIVDSWLRVRDAEATSKGTLWSIYSHEDCWTNWKFPFEEVLLPLGKFLSYVVGDYFSLHWSFNVKWTGLPIRKREIRDKLVNLVHHVLWLCFNLWWIESINWNWK